MNPIIFDSAVEQRCLRTYTKSEFFIHRAITFHFNFELYKSANWTGNLNYWTGGLQGCRGLWGWCAGATFIRVAENLTWAPNQPEMRNENENCLHMRIFENDSSTALSDRKCSDKYIYACKVPSSIKVQNCVIYSSL
jgi:hypothetical protein